jgi:hypothetical protein
MITSAFAEKVIAAAKAEVIADAEAKIAQAAAMQGS